MNWPLITDCFILAWIIGGFVYEFAVIVGSRGEDSISWEVWQIMKRRPVFAFLFGFVCGHWVWQMSS